MNCGCNSWQKDMRKTSQPPKGAQSPMLTSNLAKEESRQRKVIFEGRYKAHGV